MSFTILGYAAQSADTKLAAHKFARRDPRADDVVIDILYCGVCHSDLHQTRNDWGVSVFPMVPGHEIIGKVTRVGSGVKKHHVGDLVGVGCLVDSCQHCISCEHDLEQYCKEVATQTYNDKDRHDGSPTFGGYSEKIVVSEKFVLKVPEKLDIKSAAPLLCAGITTYSPLRHWNVKPGSKVAVIGLGGLGHMALKLAKGMGAEVTLFTRSAGKENEARRLGADHVVLSSKADQMANVAGQFELIIDTVPYQHDVNPYMSTLNLDGTLVLVGLLGQLEPAVQTAPMIMGRQSIAGSLIGGLAETQEMLEFCAEKGITCDVEMINIQDINEAYERMLKSDVKYRFVIDMASLKKTA
ncbi:NAD(P)-dependent alcohol dehydrogenase [Acerihabitans sp. TG2]|uniref:NAD(P)-dependent alcohol dehydrogenase n=1 Tax=Acerihabitans sp. TG2 TaxID=3096008 RepID=UPI002B23C723|nr:NAD(P)-dependent alcohol dehydrogenase [Acerihabitans sp. TG2]MEA9391435.1 NAD(P)-dependent alcohol dehydrogenase [Acerihabitans sp. TG2]